MFTTLKKTGVALVAMLALPGVALADTTLTYSSWLPLTHHLHTNALAPFFEQIETVTEGRVKVKLLPKLVGTMPVQFDAVRDGLVDMALFVPGATTGRFPLIELGELPLLEDEPSVAAPAVWRMYARSLERYDEFKNVQVLSLFSTAAGHFCMNKVAIREPADLTGMKLRTALASTFPLIEALGAVPVQKPTGEIYESLSGGILDGTLLGPEAVVGFSLTDVVDHITIVPGGLYSSVLGVIVNESKWAGISAGDQQAIMGLAGEALAKSVGDSYSAEAVTAVDVLNEMGKDLWVAEGALMEAIETAAVPSVDIWIDKATAKGVEDPQAIITAFREDLETSKAAYLATR